MDERKQAFIEFMMASDVLRFGSFVTKSGRNTPYFINTGNYRTGKQIATLAKFYGDFIHSTIGDGFDALFGPAYKGIPLAAATAAYLATAYDMDKPYFFNRKEAKDHGEGGNLVGYAPKDGDRVAIIEDVITAGTAVRETLPILKNAADIQLLGMIISVDRMEKGTGDKSAVQEVYEEFGLKVYPIVTIADIIDCLRDGSIPGKKKKKKMLEYRKTYGIQ